MNMLHKYRLQQKCCFERGVLIENNVGLLYYKGKEVNNESDQLPF